MEFLRMRKSYAEVKKEKEATNQRTSTGLRARQKYADVSDEKNAQKIDICRRNMNNPKNFAALLRTVDPAFLKHSGSHEMAIFKEIVEKSNTEHNPEVNGAVLKYLHSAAMIAKSSDALKGCYNLANLDMESKKAAGYDMNDTANQKAVAVVKAGLKNSHNTIESYGDGYDVMTGFAEYSDSMREQVRTYVNDNPMVLEIDKIVKRRETVSRTETAEYMDRQKYHAMLIKASRGDVSDVALLKDLLKDADPQFLGDENSGEMRLVNKIVKASAENPETNDFVLGYVKNVAAKTDSPDVLKGCYSVAYSDLKAKREQGVDLENAENLKAMDITKTGLLNKHNDIYSWTIGYTRLTSMSEFSQKALQNTLEFEEQHPASQAFDKFVGSKAEKGHSAQDGYRTRMKRSDVISI